MKRKRTIRDGAHLTREMWDQHEREKELEQGLGLKRGGFWGQLAVDPDMVSNLGDAVHFFFNPKPMPSHPHMTFRIPVHAACVGQTGMGLSLADVRRVPFTEIGLTHQLVCESCWRLVVVNDL